MSLAADTAPGIEQRHRNGSAVLKLEQERTTDWDVVFGRWQTAFDGAINTEQTRDRHPGRREPLIALDAVTNNPQGFAVSQQRTRA